jgi:hypothetical protein
MSATNVVAPAQSGQASAEQKHDSANDKSTSPCGADGSRPAIRQRGHGRLMKEWVVVAEGGPDWLELAKEAYEFVKRGHA